ncbi:MAG: YicC family protein [Alphaproteobacteria bacterium]|nr:YicC family protein [Alphaproteobacteria bacterium]
MSIISMTGYARSQGACPQFSWIWEAKSVNGKGLEVRLRLPPGHDSLELPARDKVAKGAKRGNINLSLNVTRQSQSTAPSVNRALLDSYLTLAMDLAREHGLPTPSAESVMGLRGVIETADEASLDEAGLKERDALLLASLDEALFGLAAMRKDEGARMAEILTLELNEIERLSKAARETAALRPEAIRTGFKSKLDELLNSQPPVSEERLAQELALLIAKGDVREELDRLDAHVQAARDMLKATDPVGRRLDFLCQEFNRESNTLCSKSSDVELTRIGLALKAVIEQFREQVQNIE